MFFLLFFLLKLHVIGQDVWWPLCVLLSRRGTGEVSNNSENWSEGETREQDTFLCISLISIEFLKNCTAKDRLEIGLLQLFKQESAYLVKFLSYYFCTFHSVSSFRDETHIMHWFTGCYIMSFWNRISFIYGSFHEVQTKSAFSNRKTVQEPGSNWGNYFDTLHTITYLN